MKNSSFLAAAQHNLSSNHADSLMINPRLEHVHQPLLLMQRPKRALAMNQHQLGLKLLNQSKQIQRKLNELESKVDRIQAADCKQQPRLSATCKVPH